MQKFVDRGGNVWVVQIDVSTIKRVRSLTGVDLLSVVEGELIEQLSRDPVLLCDVLSATTASVWASHQLLKVKIPR